MANSAGIYLELDGKILLLCDESWGAVPNGVAIAKFPDFAKGLGLKAGEEVLCRDGCLHFGENCITIAQTEKQEVPFGPRVCREPWQAGIRALRGREKGLAPLAEPLLEGGEAPEGNPLCTLALPRLERLLEGLRSGGQNAVEEGAKSLLGLGPGLTPSGDDVLCGLVWGLQRSSLRESPAVRVLTEAVCREGEKRTHPVSAAYLTAIARGEAFERLEKAWAYLTGAGENCLEALLEVGSSSGGDCLLGLLLAAKILRMEEGRNGGTDRTDTVG